VLQKLIAEKLNNYEENCEETSAGNALVSLDQFSDIDGDDVERIINLLGE
jgi:hypothetical protein